MWISSLPWLDVVFPHILSRLDVVDCFALRRVSPDAKSLVDSYFHHMRQLDLTKYAANFDVRHFRVLAERCASLRRVVLSRCMWVTDNLLKILFSNNRSITYLVLNRCRNLTTACLQSVIVNCKGLRTLRLEGCEWVTVGCLEAVTLHQTSLEDIDLGSSRVTTTRSLNCFFSKFPQLITINLERNSIMDQTLVVITLVCRRLCNINLRFCPLLTDMGIRYMATCGSGSLRCLLLRGCVNVSPMCVNTLPPELFVDMRQK